MSALSSYEKNRAAFIRFHKDNPYVYHMYIKFARQAKAAGHKTLSISLLTERIRWEMYIETVRQDDGFKISNNHKPFYARLLNNRPEFKDMFVLKMQTSRNTPDDKTSGETNHARISQRHRL